MKYYSPILIYFISLLYGTAFSQTQITGNVSGLLTKLESPYLVIGDINIPKDHTLSIEPGVLIQFNGHYDFLVDSSAKLLAIGTEIDSIIFTPIDKFIGWGGLNFNYSDSLSILKYCRIDYAKVESESGGGISCYNSNITISNCTIQNNSAGGPNLLYGGGGIECSHSSPLIENNYISNNEVHGKYGCGGGIFCFESSPRIINNNIFFNIAEGAFADGGGIYCIQDSDPLIFNNKIFYNTASYAGGGIACEYEAAPIILNNIICYNKSGRSGGIECLDESNPIINNNTISKNNATDEDTMATGGGIRSSFSSFPKILNTIVWDNISYSGKQITLFYSDDIVVEYSNVQGGWSGLGNINANPLYTDTINGDYHLLHGSPCIDTGNDSIKYNDPEDPNNPGYAFYPSQGTVRNDMGAYGGPGASDWNHIPIPVELSSFTAKFLENAIKLEWQTATETNNQEFDLEKQVGNKGSRGESWDKIGFVQGNGTTTEIRNYSFIDTDIKPGKYFYRLKQIDFDGSFIYSNIVEVDLNILSARFELYQNYPNPFNPTTTLNYSVPKTCFVKIKIYDVLGKEIATLVNGDKPAGNYEVEFNGSNLASGVYFYRMQAGSFNTTKKFIFLK